MTTAIQTPFRTGRAAEKSHWYSRSGEPCYEVQSKNGEWRSTTLRDARKNGWLPSVTGVINVAAKPGLERWKNEQTLLACLTSPKLAEYTAGGMLEKDFLAHVYECANAQAAEAAAEGTAIHAAIERFFLGEQVEPERLETAMAAHAAVMGICDCDKWQAETSFGSLRYGFGGKIDLVHPAADCQPVRIVIDFKGKDFDESQIATDGQRKLLKDSFSWPEQAMQLAAYDCGSAELTRPEAHVLNIFFSRRCPGLVLVGDEWGLVDLERRWGQFLALLQYWRLEKGYDPRNGARG